MVGALLSAEGYDVAETANAADAIARVRDSEPDVALLDLMMPGDQDGIVALEKLRDIAPDLPVIMMSGRAGLADAVKATKLGACNFLEKPLTPEGVLLSVASAVDRAQARPATSPLRATRAPSGRAAGERPPEGAGACPLPVRMPGRGRVTNASSLPMSRTRGTRAARRSGAHATAITWACMSHSPGTIVWQRT